MEDQIAHSFGEWFLEGMEDRMPTPLGSGFSRGWRTGLPTPLGSGFSRRGLGTLSVCLAYWVGSGCVQFLFLVCLVRASALEVSRANLNSVR